MKATRITKTFSRLAQEGRKAFIPYIMSGSPSLNRTRELLALFERAGADIVELGVPFSDPLADGPVIQAAAGRALANGVTLTTVIELVREVRTSGLELPLVLMTYYNPVYKYGVERFVRDAVEAGVDGVIVPDLPPHEAAELMKPARKYGLNTIFLFAPTSTEKRRALVARSSTGFCYYVSITGTTGSELVLDKEALGHMDEVRRTGSIPVALGFGVKTPENARSAARLADAVIVGSEIVKRTEDPDFEQYVHSLVEAIQEGSAQADAGQADSTQEDSGQ